MQLDRDIQRKILLRLQEEYPDSINFVEEFKEYPQANINVVYLYEHGLIDGEIMDVFCGNVTIPNPRITAKGLDFLAEDGGLSAILGVVTVRLHADTVRALLSSGIDMSNASEEKKSSLKKILKSVPEKVLSTLVQECVSLAVRSGGEFLHLIQNACG